MIDAQIYPLKVSILIPIFNRKDYITECIQSALDQTFTDFEVVVVDNASNDGTWEICLQFAADDRRVRIFRNESNIGPVRNWMRCAQEAKGEFSKILFSDDCLEPNCLSEMTPKLDNSEVGLVYCAVRIGKSKNESTIAYSQIDSSRLIQTQFLDLILSGKAPLSPGAVLIRTSDLLKNLHTTFPTSTPRDFEKNGAGPDVMILLLTAHDYPFVANIEKPLVYFRVHSGSFSIENLNNDVVKGYRSAISFFLLKNHGRIAWINYLAQIFIDDIHNLKKLKCPMNYINEYEGSAAPAYIAIMLLRANLLSFKYTVKFLITKFGKFKKAP